MKEIHAGYAELISDTGSFMERYSDKDFTGRRQLRTQQI
jgi:hypothetical protein